MKYSLIIIVTLFCLSISAQTDVRIYQKDGTCLDVPIEQIDSIAFANKDADSVSIIESELCGNWLWGNTAAGYYEVLSFNKDHTYTGYDNYFTYGFDTTTYGFYSQYGTMLTLWSNGFGYQHRYTWYITGLTSNALSVMTKMGTFTYYRLQPEVIKLKVGETLSNSGDDTYIFADGVIVRLEDNMLNGVAKGETYLLKMSNSSQRIWGYKVVVE